ncbi:MAG TPA: 30S ribosomal protein S6 [Bacteroidota bacterium]|nr:30S ribosomal protein S6 [Bacteroidota bacterium]
MDQQRRKVYETTFILNATLDDAQIDQIIEKFREFVSKQSGEIKVLDKWGRKRLSYPIQKKNNGFYVVSEFTAPSDMIIKLERHFTLDENIMRFLTIQLSEKALKAREQQAKLTEKDEAAAAEAKLTPRAPVAGDVETKAPEGRK